MKKIFISVSILFSPCIAYAQSPDVTYSSIWSFGDSLSDTGRVAYSTNPDVVRKIIDFLPETIRSAYDDNVRQPKGDLYYQKNRFSNGPVWVEVLHDINSKPLNYSQIHNLAYGGAVIGELHKTPSSYFINNVQEQVTFFNKILLNNEICDSWALSCNTETSWHNAVLSPVRNVRAKLSSPNSNHASAARISTSELGQRPLVTFGIGGNNFRQEIEDISAEKRNLQTPRNAILRQVSNELRKINDGLSARQDIGKDGITYYVATIPNVAATPKFRNLENGLKSDLFNTVKQTNRDLKKQIYELGDEFASKNAKTRVVIVDADAFLAEVIRSPHDFGFSEVNRSCISSSSGLYANGCSGTNVSDFLFWDEFHPTDKAHAMLARYAQNSDWLEAGATTTLANPHVASIEWRDRIYSGTIAGTGSLIKQGEAVLTLAGTNTYSGGTRIDNGTLRISSDDNLGHRSGRLTLQGGALQATRTLAIQRDITVNPSVSAHEIGGSQFGGTFNVGAGVELTLGNTLSGSGDILKEGKGELDIRSTMTDGRALTQVNSGILNINTTNAYRSTKVVVMSGADLGGSGTVVGTIEIGGQLTPGNSIGTLNIVGDLILHDSAQYTFEADTHIADMLHVSGNIVVDGDVHIVWDKNDKLLDQVFPVLRHGGKLTGAFDNLIEHSAFLDASLVYGGNAVHIAFSRDFRRPAVTENQNAVATHLNAAFRKEDQGDLDHVFFALDSLRSVPEAARALDVLSGKSLGNTLTASAIQQGQFTRAVEDRLAARRSGRESGQDIATPPVSSAGAHGLGTVLQGAAAAAAQSGSNTRGNPEAVRDTNGVSVWARALGGPAKVRGSFNVNGFGVLAGVDKEIGNGLLGVSVGYGNFNTGTNAEGKADADRYHVAAYGSFRHDQFFVDGTAGYTYSDYQSTRTLAFGDLSRVAHGKAHGNDVSLSFKAGVNAFVAGVTIEPSLGFDWYRLNRGSFIETGADAAGLRVRSQAVDLVLPSIGVRLSSTFQSGSVSLSPELSARYYYNAGDRTSETRAGLIGTPFNTPDFIVKTAGLDRHIGVVSAGLSAQTSENLRFFGRYELALSDKVTANSFSAGLKYSW